MAFFASMASVPSLSLCVFLASVRLCRNAMTCVACGSSVNLLIDLTPNLAVALYLPYNRFCSNLEMQCEC
jgi:hypothetical protein